MRKEARFVLPLCPSVNACYSSMLKSRRDGKSYTKRVASQALRLFQQEAPLRMHQQGLRQGSWQGVQAVGYELIIYVPTTRSDLSNRLKAYEDVVSQYLGFDDKIVIEGHFTKRVDQAVPRIEGHWFTLE